MKESIFRKESLESIHSPGQLNRCIRVAEPGVWILLAAMVVVLAGALVWGIFGNIETTLDAVVTADAAGAVCCVNAADAGRVQPGMTVRAGDLEGSIIAPVSAREALDLPQDASVPTEDISVFRAEFDSPVEGVFDAQVILERISPITFVIG